MRTKFKETRGLHSGQRSRAPTSNNKGKKTYLHKDKTQDKKEKINISKAKN